MKAVKAINLPLVFAHGWGAKDSFWQPLTALLPQKGYVLNLWQEQQLDLPPYFIAIGHSYGALYLQKQYAERVRGIVIISGFTDFLAATPLRVLKRMQQQFLQNPQRVIADFQQRAAMPAIGFSEKEYPFLANALQEIGEKISPPTKPYLALHGAQDVIMPIGIAQKQLVPLQQHPHAGHGLPWQYPEWCAAQIQQWIATHAF